MMKGGVPGRTPDSGQYKEFKCFFPYGDRHASAPASAILSDPLDQRYNCDDWPLESAFTWNFSEAKPKIHAAVRI